MSKSAKPNIDEPASKMSRREALRRVGALLGGALSVPAFSGVLGGCQPSASPDWVPQLLDAAQDELVAVVSERIIPATDTPGAEAAQVNRFIDKMLAEWYDEERRTRFLSGLADIDAMAERRFGRLFAEAAREEQVQLLGVLDQRAFAPEGADTGPPGSGHREEGQTRIESAKKGAAPTGGAEKARAKDTTKAGWTSRAGDAVPFFRMMKELTLLGYYTSDIGMNQELNRRIVPGRYEGCLPLTEVRPSLRET